MKGLKSQTTEQKRALGGGVLNRGILPTYIKNISKSTGGKRPQRNQQQAGANTVQNRVPDKHEASVSVALENA